MALSNTLGKGSRVGYNAVFRKFQGTKDQVVIVNNGRQLKNKIGNCLTPEHFKNDDNQALIWHKCKNLNIQKFSKEFGKASQPISYKEKLDSLKKKVKAKIFLT
jgi:hypothetical protein